jgi:hypothetical protein
MMNERINLLLEQSGLQPYYDAQEGQIEKFAELIIEDCIFVVDGAVHHRLPASSYVDLIKEHFAVE